MAYKRFVAAAVFAAFTMAASTQVQAQAPCRKQCDASFSSCSKKGADQNTCLRSWHGCKKTCTAKMAAVATRATPGKPPVTQRGR